MKNSLEEFKGSFQQAAKTIHELEDKAFEIIKSEEQKERLRKKWTEPEEGKREKGVERLFEKVMIKNFPNVMKDMTVNVQET